MLETQLFLEKNDIESLQKKFKIKTNYSSLDDRCILNYTIDSPKESKITIECRSLTINKYNNKIIAKGFNRFYNYSEALSITKHFRWDLPITAYDKIDGSFIKVFYWNGWKIQTRNSFGNGEVNGSGFSWVDLVKQCIPSFEGFSKDYTYIFELTSPYNKVVQIHNDVSVWLLTCFMGVEELNDDIVDSIARELNLKRPARHTFNDLMDVQAYIADQARGDSTFEGVVLKDVDGMRLKVKSDKYVALHRLFDNGNILLDKNIVPLIIDGEIDEVCTYFPVIKKRATLLDELIKERKQQLDDYWYVYNDEKSKKKFVEYVKDCHWRSLLYMAYDYGGHPFDYITTEFVVKNI